MIYKDRMGDYLLFLPKDKLARWLSSGDTTHPIDNIYVEKKHFFHQPPELLEEELHVVRACLPHEFIHKGFET